MHEQLNKISPMRIGELSSINVCVTQNRIMELISILTSIPLPESDNMAPTQLSKDSNRFGSSISLLKYLDDRQKNVTTVIPETVYEIDETEVTQFTDIEISFVLNGNFIIRHGTP